MHFVAFSFSYCFLSSSFFSKAYRKTFARSTFPRGGALNASSETVLDKDSQLSLTSQETSNHVLNILKNARGKSERGSDEIDASDRLTIAPHRMWKALSLAEGIVNSGEHIILRHLDSRLERK